MPHARRCLFRPVQAGDEPSEYHSSARRFSARGSVAALTSEPAVRQCPLPRLGQRYKAVLPSPSSRAGSPPASDAGRRIQGARFPILKTLDALGRKLGRPKGSLGVSRLDGREDDIELSVSKTDVAKLTGVSRTALYSFVKSGRAGPGR